MERDDKAERAHQSVADNWFIRYHEQKPRIADWVSTFRDGRACELVDICCGSFNWGCRILFKDETEWLVRFAVPGMVMDGNEKLRREVAAMILIGRKTTIPVPKVHAWGLSEQNPLGLGPFIVMDYIHGESLGRLWRESDKNKVLRADIDEHNLHKVFRQIAGFYLELSTLKFPSAGSLSIGDDQSIQADLSPLTLKMQEIEAHSGVKVGGDSATFPSATEYFFHVAGQDMAHLYKQPNSINDEHDAQAKYKFRHRLNAILPHFIDDEYDRTDFRLVCDDFRYGNMIVNNPTDLKIVAVLDWEWTYAAPYQLFISPPPPRWLLIQKPIEWDEPFGSQFQRYQACLDLFLRELEHVENENATHQHEKRLSILMRRSLSDGKFWFHELMYDCFTPADNPAFRAICDIHPEVMPSLPSEESELENFVNEKMTQLAAYTLEWKAMEASE